MADPHATPDRVQDAAVEMLAALYPLESVEERVKASALAMRVAIETKWMTAEPASDAWRPWSERYGKATRS